MVDRGIARRDVQSFVENQAELRKEFKLVDISTLRTSMVAKLKDTKLNLRSLQKKVVEIKKDLLLECNGKRHKFRRIVKNLRKDPEKLKENLINKYRTKIQHLSRVQKYNKAHWPKPKAKSDPHSRLQKYKDLTIFKSSESFPKPIKPLGPFICERNIKLSEDETRLLSKQPKFSVLENINDIDVLAEIERMLSKHRMNENSHKKKKEKEDNKKAIAGGRLNDKAANETEIKKDKESLREEVIRELWDDNEERFIYNPIKKTINFTKARPTDYVLNKHIHLPKPLEIEEEINCEIRKKEFMKAFKEYTDRKKEMGETGAGTKRKKERHL